MSFVQLDITDLEFFEKLGGGASGSVYRAKWKSTSGDKFVAAKKMLTLDKEPEVLSSLSHRNIVQFFGAVVKPPNFCIITEYAELGSLYDFLRKNTLDYSQILLWAKQIAMGMNYLHCEAPIPVIHRDLKSKNVVIAMDLTAKICDFGSSKFHSHTTKMTLVGTFAWMAPEIIQQLPVTSACDVFSYSVVLWELLTDEIPFHGLEGMQIAWLVVAKNQRLMIPDSCPTPFSFLMKRCWESEPQKRPTFKHILDALDNMLENESLKEETDGFLHAKATWKSELDVQLKELRSAEKDLTVKAQELQKREEILKEREMQIKVQRFTENGSMTRETPHSHDVASWSQEEVANWVYHVGGDELNDYADLFVKNNITGKRLFLLTGDDLLQIGILSVGHRKELLDAIGKLKNENYRLLNFPPLPNQCTTSPARPLSISGKEEPLTVLFGNLYRIHGECYKWKMFVDFEGASPAISGIKEVAFFCSQTRKGEKQVLHNPPFVTGSWIKKSVGELIECTIKFKDGIVSSPHQTTLGFQLKDSPVMEEKQVKLEMVRRERHSSGQISIPQAGDMTRTLSPTPSAHRLSGVWSERTQLLPSVDTVATLMTNSSIVSSETDSMTSCSSSSSSQKDKNSTSDAYRGQPLQGAWGSSNMTAAAMLKKSLSNEIPPPHVMSRTSSGSGGGGGGSDSRRGSSGSESSLSTSFRRCPSKGDERHLLSPQHPGRPLHSPQETGNPPWKTKQHQQQHTKDLNRSRSSSDQRKGDIGRGVTGDDRRRGGGDYYRSVSDNSYAQGHRHRGGKSGGVNRRGGGGGYGNYPQRHPTSEPAHKRN